MWVGSYETVNSDCAAAFHNALGKNDPKAQHNHFSLQNGKAAQLCAILSQEIAACFSSISCQVSNGSFNSKNKIKDLKLNAKKKAPLFPFFFFFFNWGEQNKLPDDT